MIVIAATVTSPENPGKWNSTHENGTEDLSMGAIGAYAPARGNVGVDKSGKLKPKWLIG